MKSERDDKRGGAGCAIGLTLAFMFLPVLYVLSVGPVVWLMDGKEVPQLIVAFYYPLELLGRTCRPFHEAMERYINWWS